jgi:dTDP-4-amino-4,6-dideoxygalactose transaminase
MQRLLDKGIATRRGVMCVHRELPYVGAARFPLPRSEEAQDRCILLPLYPDMSEADQDRVVEGLLEVCRP